MVVLHIASIDKNPFCGVCVAVPQHIIHQQKIADVGFVNVRNITIEGVDNQFDFCKEFDISLLPEPFSKPDIVIFHEVYRLEFLKISKNLMKNKIPYIILPHGSLTREVQGQRRLKKMAGNFLLFGKFIKGARAIQCLSENEMSRIDFKNEKFVSTTGIDMPEKGKEDFSKKTVNINYIGRLEMYTKGLDMMAEAVAKNAEFLRGNNYVINIYGPDYVGNKKPILREMINRLCIQNILLIKDEVSGEEKKKILLDTDIFFQTSRTEGMPMGIIEAMSYGVPCLVTKGTTWGDYIIKYDAGWVAENNAESIAEKLQLAIEERELWNKKSEAARRSIAENYDWSAVAKNALKEYSKYL